MTSRVSVQSVAVVVLLAIASDARNAVGQSQPSNGASAFKTFSLYADRNAAAGTTDHVNIYPVSLGNAALMVLHTVGSVTDSVALLNSQPNDATGMQVDLATPASYAEFAIVPPRLATSIAVSANGYNLFAGFDQFDDFLKPLVAVTVTYEDNSTWSATLNVDQHVRNYIQSNTNCGTTTIFPATGLPYDSLVVALYASGGYFLDMQELRLPRVPQKVARIRVEAVGLDHFCSTFVPHIYAGFRLNAVSLWPRFQIANRAGMQASLLRQDDAAWGASTYGGYRDEAGILRSTDSTIAYDGCLLTCVTMLHRYFGMADGRGRPDSLNNFLQGQGGYRPSFGVYVDSAAAATAVGSLAHFQWAISAAPVGTTFDVEAGTDSLGPYPIATLRVVNADAAQGRARVVAVQRPSRSMVGLNGWRRGEMYVFRAGFDYSSQGWYPYGLPSADSVEISLADSLPVILQVEGREHWAVATGMAPAWVSSTQAQGTYPLLDPLRGPGARLVEAQYGNLFTRGVVGRRFGQLYPAPAGPVATTSATATPELGIVLSGPGSATIIDPAGRTIAYDAGTDEYVSGVPGAIARRGVRHGDVSDPNGLFGAVDDFEIPNALTGSYVVTVTGSASGQFGALAEGNIPGVRVTDATQRFTVSGGTSSQFLINYSNSGVTAVSMGAVTGVEGTALPSGTLRVSPNPITGPAAITFVATVPAAVQLDVFDALGRHVTSLIDGLVGPGQHTRPWNPRMTAGGIPAAGVYFVRLKMAGKSGVARVVVLN